MRFIVACPSGGHLKGLLSLADSFDYSLVASPSFRIPSFASGRLPRFSLRFISIPRARQRSAFSSHSSLFGNDLLSPYQIIPFPLALLAQGTVFRHGTPRVLIVVFAVVSSFCRLPPVSRNIVVDSSPTSMYHRSSLFSAAFCSQSMAQNDQPWDF